MVTHGTVWEHPVVLSFSDLSVWCYLCEAYVHNQVTAQTHPFMDGWMDRCCINIQEKFKCPATLASLWEILKLKQ